MRGSSPRDLTADINSCTQFTIFSQFPNWLTINSKCSVWLEISPADSLKNIDRGGLHRFSKILTFYASFWVPKLETLIRSACISNDICFSSFLWHCDQLVIPNCWELAVGTHLLKIASSLLSEYLRLHVTPSRSSRKTHQESFDMQKKLWHANPKNSLGRLNSESCRLVLHVISSRRSRKTHQEYPDMQRKTLHLSPEICSGSWTAKNRKLSVFT